MESFSSSFALAAGSVRSRTPRGADESGSSQMPSAASIASAFSATSSACARSLSGSGVQSTLVEAASRDTGTASRPQLGTPSFFASTRVVPVPQNGSRTRLSAPRPNRRA